MKSVYIEITNVCNLHCSFCPCGTLNGALSKASDGALSKAPNNAPPQKIREFMPTQLFEKALEGACQIHAESVYFHVLGEPTLHPGFALFINKLEKTALKLNLTTNGTTIVRTGKKILSSKAVRQINFSTHAYAELPRNIAEDNLQNVLDFCKMAIFARPDLYINLRMWNIGDSSATSWNAYMLQRINEAFGTNVYPENFCSRHKSFNITGRIYIHEDSRFEWPQAKLQSPSDLPSSQHSCLQTSQHSSLRSGDLSKTPYPQGTCRALDTHVAILHDGRVVACCLDYAGNITLGNINEESLPAILEKPFTKNILDGFTRHELRHPFCQNCSFCKRFK